MANPCDSVLDNGIWEFTQINDAAEFQQNLYRFFSQNKFASKSSARKRSGQFGITIPVEGIPINANGLWGSEQNGSEYYSDALVEEYMSNESFRRNFQSINQRASETIVSAWSTCMQFRDQGGVFSTTEYPSDEQAHIKVMFNRYVGDDTNSSVSINRQTLADQLAGLGLELMDGLEEEQELIRGVPLYIDIGVPQNQRHIPRIIAVQLESESNLYQQFIISLPRIIEQPIVWQFPTGQFHEQTIATASSTTFQFANESNNFVKTELQFVFSFKSFDEGPARRQASANVAIYDHYRRLLLQQTVVYPPHGGPRANAVLPTQIVPMEPGEVKTLRVEVFNQQNIYVPSMTLRHRY
jgi:hypothetical protein